MSPPRSPPTPAASPNQTSVTQPVMTGHTGLRPHERVLGRCPTADPEGSGIDRVLNLRGRNGLAGYRPGSVTTPRSIMRVQPRSQAMMRDPYYAGVITNRASCTGAPGARISVPRSRMRNSTPNTPTAPDSRTASQMSEGQIAGPLNGDPSAARQLVDAVQLLRM